MGRLKTFKLGKKDARSAGEERKDISFAPRRRVNLAAGFQMLFVRGAGIRSSGGKAR